MYYDTGHAVLEYGHNRRTQIMTAKKRRQQTQKHRTHVLNMCSRCVLTLGMLYWSIIIKIHGRSMHMTKIHVWWLEHGQAGVASTLASPYSWQTCSAHSSAQTRDSTCVCWSEGSLLWDLSPQPPAYWAGALPAKLKSLCKWSCPRTKSQLVQAVRLGAVPEDGHQSKHTHLWSKARITVW